MLNYRSPEADVHIFVMKYRLQNLSTSFRLDVGNNCWKIRDFLKFLTFNYLFGNIRACCGYQIRSIHIEELIEKPP